MGDKPNKSKRKISDEDLPLNCNFSGYNSERELERAFCQFIKNNPEYRLVGRQLPTITGRLDVLVFQVSPENQEEVFGVEVFELKNRKIKCRDVDQVLRYARELKMMLYDLIPTTTMLNSLKLAIEVGLVGEGISQKAHEYLNTSDYPISIYFPKEKQTGFEPFDYVDSYITEDKLEYIKFLLSKLDIPIQEQFLLQKDRLSSDMTKLREEFGVMWSKEQGKEESTNNSRKNNGKE